MAELILITGGSRSGKSAFAQQLAEGIIGSRVFLATCPQTDPEMTERIRRHQADRKNRGWQSVEEPLQPAKQLVGLAPETTVLIDCLTLWVNNLQYEAEKAGREILEDQVAEQAAELARIAGQHRGTVIMVTNEVGLGIVPDNALARRYRDLVGRCNQVIGAAADKVFLVTCGIPLQIK
jgi:adenosylcobinamide kinase/adenosylcobinamide-phosphate guanylyltransferase